MSNYENEFVMVTVQGLTEARGKIEVGQAIAEGTEKVLSAWAEDVKAKSAQRIQEHRHPSGLFKVKGKALPAPEFQVKRISAFYYKVQTPRGKWNIPASRVEMMQWSNVPQGMALVRNIENEYRLQKGRNMYHNYDRVEAKYKRIFEAVEKAVEESVNKVTA